MKYKFSARKLALVAFLVFVVGFGYVAWQTTQQYEEESVDSEGLVICNENVCEKSVHIHADIHAYGCGEEIDIHKNEGKVTQQHTHSEESLMHFHNKLQVDKETEEYLDTTSLRLGNFFENIGMPFSRTQVNGYNDGDVCPGSSEGGSVRMSVNGVDNTEFDKYIWKDDDEIVIRFE